MRPTLKIAFASAAVLIVVGLLVPALVEVRAEAARGRCRNNLRQIGLALHNSHDIYEEFPRGTIHNPELPPEKRLSWYPMIYPIFMMGGIRSHIDRNKAWDDPVNCPPRESAREIPGVFVEEPIDFFQCSPVAPDPDLPSLTHYIGVAGVGADSATLLVAYRRAGFFGYDRKVTIADIKDGNALTIAVLESQDGGPWTAGGRATVRGLDRDGDAYIGGQFASQHRRGTLPWSKRMATNALFGDASVRLLSEATSPEVIEALATIAGKDEVSGWSE